jgi:hypothetical protein
VTTCICAWSDRDSSWERPQDALTELRALSRDVPRSRSFVDELLAERRLAAATE